MVDAARELAQFGIFSDRHPNALNQLVAKTAAVAGFAWWVVSTLADATWGSFRLVPIKALPPLSAVSLPEMIVAVLVGAWLYKE